MTNLSRKTAKIFGETAATTGSDPEIGQFGSAKAGTYLGTNDVATIQSLPAWSNGWIDAVTPSQQFPSLPERTGVDFVQSYQNAYLLQKGVAEWDSGTTYYTGDFAKGVGEGKLYVSKIDNNLNNALTDTNSWEEFTSGGSSRNIGEIVTSSIPLTDAGLHLLDGALIQGSGAYSAFVDYIAELYNSGEYSAIFTTEANWQSAVSTYGVCDKFVYDSVNNTVRLPKWGNQAITKTVSTASTVPVVGNGKTLGLTNGIDNFGLCNSSGYVLQGYSTLYDKPVGDGTVTTGTSATLKGIGVVQNSKSGLVANTSSLLTQYPLSCYYYIVIATSAKTGIQVDIDQIATDVNGKADVDLTNLANTGKIAIAHNAMPSNTKYYAYTVGASGSTYTAPSDGYLMVNGTSVNTSDTLIAVNNTTNFQTSARGGTNGYLRIYLPVAKGGQITVKYTSGVTINQIRLIYAIGSESEAS